MDAVDELTVRGKQHTAYWMNELDQLGLTPKQVDEILAACPDLHAVKEALERGCPTETAFRIFS